MYAAEVTELHDYVGDGTVGRPGAESFKQHSGPKQDSGSISPLLPIFKSFLRSLLPPFYHYVLKIPLLHHYYLIITYYYRNNGSIITYYYYLLLPIITSVITSLLLIITVSLLPIITVIMVQLLRIITRSIISNNEFIISYY